MDPRPEPQPALREPLSSTPGAVARAAEAVRERIQKKPRAALVLGSGLGDFVGSLSGVESVPFAEVPGFPEAGVEGHEGTLAFGEASGVPVIVQKGRFHLYEGHSLDTVTFPIRVFHALGARMLVVTNSAGGVGGHLRPGDLMLIDDQVNFQFAAPLRGKAELPDGTRFTDLSKAFSRRLLSAAETAALREGISGVRRGVYWGNAGPAYETRAEVRMVKRLGGDAVGMSTVPEVTVANRLGMEVLGISCITNRAAGLSPEPLSHAEVMETASRARERFIRLLGAVLSTLSR